MSGTSLDGLDMALCEFLPAATGYEFRLLGAKTIMYSDAWKTKLKSLNDASAETYFEVNAAYGQFMSSCVNKFIAQTGIKPMAIASHGHTVFHQPGLGFSTQVGSGATIAAKTGITTICDFRSLDVANGGQGAPLVPIGDELLFGHYDACLNIGGIANLSFLKKGKRVAYDVCEANMLLNFLSEQMGKPYDKGGKLASTGLVNESLLKQLNRLEYYNRSGAKSIGREWFEKFVQEKFSRSKLTTIDLLATATLHIAQVIAADLNRNKIKSVLVTGGGAFNTHLISLIQQSTNCQIVLPPNEVINFKEALIFAFLGYLRLESKLNTLASVTGARSDSVGGAIYLAP